ncbi:MAG: hypothetical protein M3463_09665, partial [Verrucomicrobiota bacterium]|nr:hypothetical protein [Verrucomicrobiota bacterium]
MSSSLFPNTAVPPKEVAESRSASWRVALRRTWPWLAAITSGTLLALCFPPWNLSGLVWIALVPLICAVWFS